jgi:hypothetical protein
MAYLMAGPTQLFAIGGRKNALDDFPPGAFWFDLQKSALTPRRRNDACTVTVSATTLNSAIWSKFM